jgi:hypothetical protein
MVAAGQRQLVCFPGCVIGLQLFLVSEALLGIMSMTMTTDLMNALDVIVKINGHDPVQVPLPYWGFNWSPGFSGFSENDWDNEYD